MSPLTIESLILRFDSCINDLNSLTIPDSVILSHHHDKKQKVNENLNIAEFVNNISSIKDDVIQLQNDNQKIIGGRQQTFINFQQASMDRLITDKCYIRK